MILFGLPGDEAVEHLPLARRQAVEPARDARPSRVLLGAGRGRAPSAVPDRRRADDSSSNGFSMKSTAPAFIASTASGTSPWPVMTMTGSSTPARFSRCDQLEPVHARHAHVGDDAARLERPAAPSRKAERRLVGPHRRARRCRAGTPANRATASSSSITWTIGVSSPSLNSSLLTARRVKRNVAPPSVFGSAQMPAAMRLDDRARDRQADAHARRAWW